MPAFRRSVLAALLVIVVCAAGLYFFNQYWIHRYDALIARQAAVYRLDPDLVWSIIYEETYFRPWRKGDAGEVGLMQVTPAVAREWAAETGMLASWVQQCSFEPPHALGGRVHRPHRHPLDALLRLERPGTLPQEESERRMNRGLRIAVCGCLGVTLGGVKRENTDETDEADRHGLNPSSSVASP